MKVSKIIFIGFIAWIGLTLTSHAYDIVQVTNTPDNTENSYSVAVFGNTVYAIWRNRNTDELYFDKSTDLGRTWGLHRTVIGVSQIPSGNPTINLPTKILLDKFGNIFVMYVNNYEDLYLFKSIDGGDNFFEVQRFTIPRSKPFDFAIDETGNIIYVVTFGERQPELSWPYGCPIYITKSVDGGNSFPGLREILSAWSMREIKIETSNNGEEVFLFTVSHRAVFNRPRVDFSKSSDYGESFEPLKSVFPGELGGGYIHWGSGINSAIDRNGKIYVFWRIKPNWDRASLAYLSESADKGENFSHSRINDDVENSAGPSSIAVDVIGNVYCTFSKEHEVYFDKRFGAGEFGVDECIVGPRTPPCNAPVIAVTSDGTDAFTMWNDSSGIDGDPDLYCTTFDTGHPFWVLNMHEMPWYENAAPYNSTGAAAAQMILNYIREGAGEPEPILLTQDEIYEYARDPEPYDGTELTPDEVDKALGHFDPYDTLVSNWADSYDSLPDGNPFKGYNYTVDTYDPASGPDAMNEYMRDICHWMAYTVTQEDWWDDGELVARPNTPAAIPIYGTYDHWVAVKGCVTDQNPCPEPHTDPYNTPDFTVYGFWMKDPLTTGIGQNTFVTASECESNYFQPLTTGDDYDGLLLQVAEPPAERSAADIKIPEPTKDLASLEFIGVETNTKDSKDTFKAMALSSLAMSAAELKQEAPIKKKGWKDLVDPHLLTDPEAVAAFEKTKMKKSILVRRIDKENSDYYLVPFAKRVRKKAGYLTSAVIMLDAESGFFKEASWTENPEIFLKVGKNKAIKLIRTYILKERRRDLRIIAERLKRLYAMKKRRMPKRLYAILIKRYIAQRQEMLRKYAKLLRYVNNAKAQLVWEPNSYSNSPYKPYWKIDINGYIWHVTQERKIIQEDELRAILNEIENNSLLMRRLN